MFRCSLLRMGIVGMIVTATTTLVTASDKTFDSAPIGGLPTGWTVAKTGAGDGSVWKIQEDATSPLGKKVLTQTASGPGPLFNLCVADQPRMADVDLTIKLKAHSGKIDQGGGPVWRYQDANNYYIARMNPLENNFRVYKVVDGQRTQLGTAAVEAASGTWHTIRIEHRAHRIQCSLNGKLSLDVTDDSIAKGGQIGFWTKADAVTSFAAPVLADLASASASKQVLVVNTQDASVSLVELATMKEVTRHKVGPRPYGIAVSRDGRTVAVGVEDEECVKFFSLPDFTLDRKGVV